MPSRQPKAGGTLKMLMHSRTARTYAADHRKRNFGYLNPISPPPMDIVIEQSKLTQSRNPNYPQNLTYM